MADIKLWHGGTRWDSPPEVGPSKKGRYEAGPGIYLTTSYERARKYAKGGKVTTQVTLCDSSKIRWLEGVKKPKTDILRFLYNTPRIRNRDSIIKYFDKYTDELVPVAHLVNLCVNHDALAGINGPLLAKWLVENDIDASLYSPTAGEKWVIVFNPAIIKLHTVIPAKLVSLDEYDFEIH